MIDPLSRRLRPSPQALETRVGDETVILHLADDTYYGLDELGTRIWGMLRDGLAPPSIRDRLAEDYAIGPERVEDDMRRFLGDLLAQGLLVEA